MINTIKPEFFPDNIRAGLEKRKELRTLGQNKYIEISKDIYNLLQNAVNLNPSQRGRAVHMLNVGAKKRKQPERQQHSQFQQPAHSLSYYESNPYAVGQLERQTATFHKRPIPNALLNSKQKEQLASQRSSKQSMGLAQSSSSGSVLDTTMR